MQVSEFTAGRLSVHWTKYVNASVVFVTDIRKLGSLIRAVVENPQDEPELRVFHVETLFGQQDEWNEVLARGLIEAIGGDMLVLCIALRRQTDEVFSWVTRQVKGDHII